MKNWTSAYKIKTPGNYPQEGTQRSEQSRKNCIFHRGWFCGLYGCQNKQKLFPYTALSDGFYNRDGVCLLSCTTWVFSYTLGWFSVSNECRAMVQVVGCRPGAVEAQVLFQVSPREICGGQSGNGTDLSPSTSGFPYLYHSLYLHVALTRVINWRLLGIW
jgi:hypothetical protein